MLPAKSYSLKDKIYGKRSDLEKSLNSKASVLAKANKKPKVKKSGIVSRTVAAITRKVNPKTK